MKNLFKVLLVVLLFIGCENEKENLHLEQQSKIDMSDFFVYTDEADDSSKAGKGKIKTCHSMAVLNKQLDANPGLYQKMYDIEYHTRKFALKPGNGNGGGNGGGNNGGGDGGDPQPDNLGVINIPVYIHVVYSNSNQNISDAQINSQITVLNDDFRKTNSDVSNAPGEFAPVAADSEITFSLAGVFRHANSTSSWGTNDSVKSTYPPITPETHLNIWVCNIGGGILGYAQFPGGSPATDGVVVGPQFFGTTGYLSAPFDKGRTLTHEVGHYLNLRHIWGDGRCNRDDFVADTPTSDRPNYGCPTYPTTHCRSTDMTMNYMDYVDDACMYMFTEGQKTRMRSLFAVGGSREAMLN